MKVMSFHLMPYADLDLSGNIRLFASEAMPAIEAPTDRDYPGFELPKVAAE